MNEVNTHGCIPNDSETQLLKAVLWCNKEGIHNWQVWKKNTDFQHLSRGCLHIVPLLYRNIWSLDVNDPMLCEYRSIYDFYKTKSEQILRRAAKLIYLLQQSNIDCTVLKGGAVRFLYYNDPYTRTMSDLDLLIPMGQYEAAVQILSMSGFHSNGTKDRYGKLISIRHGATFRSTDDIKLDLHWHVLQVNCNSKSDDIFEQNTETLVTPQFTAKTLNDTHQLIHAIVHASQRVKNKPIRWVCDATNIIQQGEVRWPLFKQSCDQLAVAPSVINALEFLSKEMQVEIPVTVLSNLRSCECSHFRIRELRAHSLKRTRFGSLSLFWNKYSSQQETLGESRNLKGAFTFIKQWCGVESLSELIKFFWIRGREKRHEVPKKSPLDLNKN